MPAKAVKRDEEVTITLSAIHWDALIRGEDRNYADHIYAQDGNGWLPYRSEAIAAVERATPGAAARRAAALAEVMERKEPFDTDAKRALKKLVKQCVSAWKKARKDDAISKLDWDHLGSGDDAPGGSFGRFGGWGVTMSPPENSIIWIHRDTPHFDRKAAWPFTDREVSYVKTAVKQSLPRSAEIIEEWHGSDFISIRVSL